MVRTCGVGVAAGEFGDPRVRLVTESDAVDQAPRDGVVAKQWGAVGQGVEFGGVEMSRLRDRREHLRVQALDQPAVGFPVRLGVSTLGEHVGRRLVLTLRDELGLDAELVERIAKERRIGGEPDESNGARRLHPHLAERRRQVVRQRAGIGLRPRDATA